MTPIPLQADIAALASAFFDGLTDPGHGAIPSERIAVVVAHPDDETVGCGALLGRLKAATVVMVTDGAPNKLAHAQAYGFASVADYAAARLAELHEALAIAGLPVDALIPLAIPDQEAAFNLVPIARRLAQIFQMRDISVVLTHAYEGGHPDHDATAFAVHAATRLLADAQPILVAEMPYYRLSDTTATYQHFRGDGMSLQIAIPLSEGEKELKRRMIAAHRSQKSVLEPFSPDVERFRPAPVYDFTDLPNEGRLLYELYDWGMTGEGWREGASKALAELGLGRKA